MPTTKHSNDPTRDALLRAKGILRRYVEQAESPPWTSSNTAWIAAHRDAKALLAEPCEPAPDFDTAIALAAEAELREALRLALLALERWDRAMCSNRAYLPSDHEHRRCPDMGQCDLCAAQDHGRTVIMRIRGDRALIGPDAI